MGDLKEMKVPALTGQNFVIWRDRLELFLDAQDLLGVVIEELSEEATTAQKNAWKKADKKAKYYIASAVPDAFYNVVEGKNTAKDMMDALENHFAVKSVSQQTHFKRELLNMKMEAGDLSTHLLKFEDLIRKLEAAGATVKEQDKLSYLFVTLPRNYDPVTSVLENIPNLSFDGAKSKLLCEETKQKSRDEFEHMPGSLAAYRTKFKKKAQITCFACGEKGHKSYECPELQEKSAKFANFHSDGVAMTAVRENFVTKSVTKENVMDMNGVAMVPSQQTDVVWTLDSGASNHMMNDVKYLDSLTDCREEIALAATEKSVVAMKRGNLKCFNNEGVKLDIKDVLYVPDLRYNLLSVKKLASNGICVSFSGNVAVMKKSGQVLGVATLKDDLYQFTVKVECKKTAFLSHLMKEKKSVVTSKSGHEASGGRTPKARMILHAPGHVVLPYHSESKRDEHGKSYCNRWPAKRYLKYGKRVNHKEDKKFKTELLLQLKDVSLN